MPNDPLLNPESVASIAAQLASIEARLKDPESLECVATFDASLPVLQVLVTGRLLREAKRSEHWRSKHFCATLSNAKYGFDNLQARSRSGKDGIFLMDRELVPSNLMQKKLFDKFLDKPDPLISIICAEFAVKPQELLPVRLVSHNMRLLGLLIASPQVTRLILVDLDINNRS